MPDSTAVTVVEVFIFVERLIERIRELECHAMQARGVVRCAVFFECLTASRQWQQDLKSVDSRMRSAKEK